MLANPVVLCIHRNPDRVRVLQENGYTLLAAATVEEGLHVLQSQPVDAIVAEHRSGLLDSSMIAAEIKQLRPNLPIVILAGRAPLPEDALQWVDALVRRSDPPYFLWAAVHFTLSVSRVMNDQREEAKPKKSEDVRAFRRTEKQCLLRNRRGQQDR